MLSSKKLIGALKEKVAMHMCLCVLGWGWTHAGLLVPNEYLHVLHVRLHDKLTLGSKTLGVNLCNSVCVCCWNVTKGI